MDINFGMRDENRKLLDRVAAMIRDEVMPLEEEYAREVATGDRWQFTERQTEILEGLKDKAKAQGLWNFWLTDSDKGFGLSTVEYAYFAEEMGKTPLGAEVFNCSAPDTGNMEVFERYGSAKHEGGMAGAAARGQDPLGLPDDRTGRGLVRRHQHLDVLRPRRRRLRAERREMVGFGRRRSALQGLHRHGARPGARTCPSISAIR